MSLGQWSTTAANNATADPSINWQEGQAPSTVNDSARAMMAALAVWFGAAEWLNYALTPTYVSGTSFTVAGNQTAIYSVGRRVRTFNTGGTVYGTISASVYTTLTTVTITPDSGALDSGLSEVDVGILNSANSSLAQVSGYFAAIGGILRTGSANLAGEAILQLQNNSCDAHFYLHNTDGLLGFYDATRAFTRWTSDTSGNFSAAGSVSCGNLSASGSASVASLTATGNIASSGGTVSSSGNVYAGSAFIGTNGDISGGTWGGSLSNWLNTNKLSVGTNAYTHTDSAHNYQMTWDGTRINFIVDGSAVASVQGVAVSDRRAKTKIRSAKNRDSLGLIEQTRFRSFDFKKKYGGQHVPVGVIAQEVSPDWVHDGDILSLNERAMLMDALHAIKQLLARVKVLEDELAQR